jgi:serine/threonine protein kinase
MIDPSKRDRESFVFEGEVLKRLDHKALPHVYRVFEHNKLKRVYMLMDYVEGKNLETLRKKQPERRFPLASTLTLMAPIVDALIYLHHQDPPIVHRDIKPANIIVPVGADEAVLVDFGSAKEYVEDNTTAVIRHGSPGYAALEQYGSGTTPRTDIYGLGATFYTLLTGVIPIDAVSRASESKGIDPLPPASLVTPDVSTAIAKTLRRAMSISIDDRFETVEEFWQELTDHLPDLQTAPGIPSFHAQQPLTPSQAVVNAVPLAPWHKRQHAPRLEKRGKLLPVLIAILLIVVAGTSYLSYLAYGSLLFSPPKAVLSTPHPTVTATALAPTVVSEFPIIAPSYFGKVGDIMTGIQTPMYLTNVQQNQGNIQGFFQGLDMVGPFKGTVTRSGSLLFKVTIWQGDGSLSFEGTIKVGGEIVGTFKVLDQHGNFTGESGLYNVGARS